MPNSYYTKPGASIPKDNDAFHAISDFPDISETGKICKK